MKTLSHLCAGFCAVMQKLDMRSQTQRLADL
jgi:hypothetical protein